MTNASPRIVAGALVLTVSIAGTGLQLATYAAGKIANSIKIARTNDTPLMGKLLVVGAATINGKKALSGSTIFNHNRIAVANTAGNFATIVLDKLGRVDLTPGTELILRFANGLISGELLAGEAVIKNHVGVKVALQTPVGLVAVSGQDPVATVVSTQELQKLPTLPEMLTQANQIIEKGGQALNTMAELQSQARNSKDVIKLNCINEKLLLQKGLLSVIKRAQESLAEAVEKKDGDLARTEFSKFTVAQEKSSQLLTEAQQCVGEDTQTPRNEQLTIDPIEPSLPDPPLDLPSPPASFELGEKVALAAAVAAASTTVVVATTENNNSCKK